jgi:hypothetical protein
MTLLPEREFRFSGKRLPQLRISIHAHSAMDFEYVHDGIPIPR